MKQTGKSWKTAEGEETLAKYLPAHVKLFEKLGQRIAADAIGTEQHLRLIKAMFIDLCKEALRNNPDTVRRRFTFHTFDREFKIEFDVKEEYVRVYRATKSNPSSKDYELINLDFNKAAVATIEDRPLILGAYDNETDDDGEEEQNAMAVAGINPEAPEAIHERAAKLQSQPQPMAQDIFGNLDTDNGHTPTDKE